MQSATRVDKTKPRFYNTLVEIICLWLREAENRASPTTPLKRQVKKITTMSHTVMP